MSFDSRFKKSNSTGEFFMFNQPIQLVAGSGLTESLYFGTLGEFKYAKGREFSNTWLAGDDSPELSKEVPERYYAIVAGKLGARSENGTLYPESGCKPPRGLPIDKPLQDDSWFAELIESSVKEKPEDFIAKWTDNMITNIEHFLTSEPVRVRTVQLEDFTLIVENSAGQRYRVYLDNYGSQYTVKVTDGINIRTENLHHTIVTRGIPKEVGFGRELPRLTHLFY